MSQFLPFIVVGLVSGSVYGLAATGLVLTYRTTGVFNFAYGAVGTASAYLFFELRSRNGLPWPVAAAITVLSMAIIGGFVMERVGRRLVEVSVATRVVATVGLLLAIQGAMQAIFGAAALDFPPFLPTHVLSLPGVNVGVDQVIVFVVSALLAAVLYLFLRRSRLGLSMQAVVDNSSLLALAGTDTVAVRTASWVIGLALAAVSGILLAPSIGLDAPLLTLLVVQAFGAAAVGRFKSLPLTFLGGLAIGVVAALSTKYVPSFPSLRGLPPSLPFIVLFAVLVLTPQWRLGQGRTRERTRPPEQPALPLPVRRFGAPVVLALAIAVPALVGTRLPIYTSGAAHVVLFASLALLVRTSGQVSLCHAAFAAVGAAAFSHLAHGAGLPWLVALLLAGALAVPVGAIIAIPAIRLSGLYLALSTFGFGVLLEQFVYRDGFMFGREGPIPAPRPSFLGIDFGGDTAFYYLTLAAAVLSLVAVASIHRSRLGRLLRALADSPLALSAQGVDVNVTRVIVFCASAFMAGVAGALLAATSGYIDGTAFGSFDSLLLLAVLAISGPGDLRAAVVAAVLLSVLPDYLASADVVVKWEPVAFGVGAIGVALAEAARLATRAQRRGHEQMGTARVAARLGPGPSRARLGAAP